VRSGIGKSIRRRQGVARVTARRCFVCYHSRPASSSLLKRDGRGHQFLPARSPHPSRSTRRIVRSEEKKRKEAPQILIYFQNCYKLFGNSTKYFKNLLQFFQEYDTI
jgi:hypothetical protein